MIYMDNAATTKISAAAAQTVKEVSENFYFNPSSHYDGGYEAKKLLNSCREEIAQLLNIRTHEVYFTSGGSESNNWALDCIAYQGILRKRKHIVSSAIEHHSILNKLAELKKRGFKITYIYPDSNGMINPQDFTAAITNQTCGAICMAVNNEVGTLQPIEAIGTICREKKVPFLVDAVQGVPHGFVDLGEMPVDFVSVSAHKFNGPRGIGILYAKETMRMKPLIYGGAQEFRLRAGTENLPAIAGMETALRERIDELQKLAATGYQELAMRRGLLINGLKEIEGCHFNCINGAQVVPIVNFYFDDVLGETLLSLMNTDGIYCSAGSACAAGDPEPSHVLKAIGLTDEAAKNSIRLSFSTDNNLADIQAVVESVKKNVKFIRGES